MFARIKRNTNTNRRSVLVCHNARFGKSVRQITVKIFGHSTDADELQAWLIDAKDWIAEHGSQWLTQHKKSQVKKRMRHKVTVTNLREESRINAGVEDIFGKLYRDIGFHHLLSKTHQETLRQIIFARLIDEVTVIGDRAMMSEENLAALESAGFYYVVAFPLRKLSQKDQASITNLESYESLHFEEEISSYKIIEKNNRKIISTYSKKRAEKDQKDRERSIKKLEKKLQSCKDAKRLINKNSYLKYVEISGKATAKLDEEKILKDARWDGLHGVITNKPTVGCEVYDVQASIMRDVVSGTRYKMLSKLTEDAKTIYDTLKIERGFSVIQLE